MQNAPYQINFRIDRRGLFLIAVSSGSLDQAVQQGQALAAVQLADGLGLDLADTFTGNAEIAADFFQRAGAAIVQTEAQTDDLLLTGQVTIELTGAPCVIYGIDASRIQLYH